MEQMGLNEFFEKYKKPNKDWKFELFDIVCKKCSSTNVEYNNQISVGSGYYGDIDMFGDLVVKCHGCGSAFTIDAYKFLG